MASANTNNTNDTSRYHLLKIIIIIAIIGLMAGLFFSGKLSLPLPGKPKTEKGN